MNTVIKYIVIAGTSLLVFFTSCKDILEVQPLDRLSTQTFWKTESDALRGLVGVYRTGSGLHIQSTFNFLSENALYRLDLTTDNGYEKDKQVSDFNNGQMNSSYPIVQDLWASSYEQIAKCNNFLENIGAVDMDENKKTEMTAEVKTIRAYFYFNMSFYWGDVPLVTNVLTAQEANTIKRTPKQEVVEFVLSELSWAAENLPKDRAASEYGRITKGAALAILGRLQMAEKMWSEALQTYKEIIDLNVYEIDPDYKALFEDEGDGSKEMVWCIKYMENDYPHYIQQAVLPFMYGGWHQVNCYNNLVEEYECKDGLTIDESPSYDSDKPYDNRDPRLYYTVFIPGYTVFRGREYVAHPDSNASVYPDQLTRRDWSGYALKKFADEDYQGAIRNYGGDFPVVRYAEVLLSYLECNMEAGQAIDQGLLDLTINQVRGRASVNMPKITETDPTKLRSILRRERRVELAYEGLRLYDLFRWNIAHIKLRDKMYGMKLTNDPSSYTDFKVDENGYYFVKELFFREDVDYLWPIPQSEMDINSNLVQNPGY